MGFESPYGFEKTLAIGNVGWDIKTDGKDDVFVILRYRGANGTPVRCTMKLTHDHTYEDAKNFVVALENTRFVNANREMPKGEVYPYLTPPPQETTAVSAEFSLHKILPKIGSLAVKILSDI